MRPIHVLTWHSDGNYLLYLSQASVPRTAPRQHPPGTTGPARCSWPWRGAYVSDQGLAMPWCVVATPDRIQLGNMAQQGALAVWNSPEYQAFPDDLP
jgi:hypothetical protein